MSRLVDFFFLFRHFCRTKSLALAVGKWGELRKICDVDDTLCVGAGMKVGMN